MHSAYSDWHHAMVVRPSLQWGLFFLVATLLFGSFFRWASPDWLPYTVGLLIVFFLLGLVAGFLEHSAYCPHHAFAYDFDHDGKISQTEFAAFQGAGYREDAFCRAGTASGSYAPGTGFGRTCGRISSDDPGPCRYNFADLDRDFKLSDMLPTASNKQGMRDGYLSADELWTHRCNLLHDMVQLSDMDPHLILTVFLPALLFESAAFGIDMGIFRKQLPQILISMWFALDHPTSGADVCSVLLPLGCGAAAY